MGQDTSPSTPDASAPSPHPEPDSASTNGAHGSGGAHDTNGVSNATSNGAQNQVDEKSIVASNGAAGASGANGVSADWEPALNASPLLPPREPLGARMAALMGRHHTFLLLVCVLSLWAIVALPPLAPREEVRPGQTAAHDIVAPYAAMLLDRTETTRRRSDAAALVPPVYNPDPGASERALLRLSSLLQVARSISARTASTSSAGASRASRDRAVRERWTSALRERTSQNLPLSLLRALSASGASMVPSSTSGASGASSPQTSGASSRWAVIERAAQDGVRAVYLRAQVRSDVSGDADEARRRIARAVEAARQKWPLNTTDSLTASEMARWAARDPNLLVDEAAGTRARRAASEGVREVFVRVRAGEVLVRGGEVVSDEKWAQLQELRLAAPRIDARTLLAQALLCSFMVGLCSAMVARLHPRLLDNPTLLWLCAAIPLLLLLFLRYTLRAPHAENVLLPLAATAAMLLTVLADARVGVLAGFAVASIGAVMARSDVALFLCSALLSWTSALSVSGLASRGHLGRAGVLVALAGGALHALLGLLRLNPWPEIISMSAWGAASGVLSILAMAALAMLLERPFGITTHLRLLELLSPDEDVLQRMLHEAPGTYTHSMTVAQLSEAAAKAVGSADALVCRAGGMYHDIGKLRRPFCFIENQTGDNVHDRIAPGLSALVIAAHVRDGLEAGRAMRLPTPILDIIAQHHGTSLISFFYEKARAQNPDVEVDESQFRYPGPKPQSKEAAIVMLADAVEASSRALPDASPPKLRAHIRAMIEGRLREGELSQCDLTLHELEVIEDAFARVLSGALHNRIAYPNPKVDLERDLRQPAPTSRRRAKPPRAPRHSRVLAALEAARESEGDTDTSSASSTSGDLASSEPRATSRGRTRSVSLIKPSAPNGKNGSNGNGTHGNGSNGHSASVPEPGSPEKSGARRR